MTRKSHDSKTCKTGHSVTLKKTKDQLSLNTGQKYCRMLQGEHSAILSLIESGDGPSHSLVSGHVFRNPDSLLKGL